MFKKHLTLTCLILTGAVAVPTVSLAASSKTWSMVAMACTPTHQTADQRKYVTTGGKVKFKNGVSGSISFICPITSPLKNGEYYLEGGFAHPSTMFGKGNALQLRTMDMHTGAVKTVLNARTTIENRNSKWGRIASTSKLIGFKNDRHVYWVQFTLSRPTGEGESPSFSAVSLVKQ